MIIVITGATKGIGRAIVENLAEKGNSFALCSRSIGDLSELKAHLDKETLCEQVMVRQVDVREKEQMENFGEAVLEKFHHVDVLINNAGIYIPGTIAEENATTFYKVMQTNLHSAYFLTKALLPSMFSVKGGHVINICSVASTQGYSDGGSYSISKHALLGFGRTLREEVRSKGIRVTNILPGATWSDSWKGADVPRERLMNPRNVAQVVRTAIEMDQNAVMEDIVLRPILGDL